MELGIMSCVPVRPTMPPSSATTSCRKEHNMPTTPKWQLNADDMCVRLRWLVIHKGEVIASFHERVDAEIYIHHLEDTKIQLMTWF